MGEIADDMVSGACCSRCSCYFEKEHGYPVLCVKCWRECQWNGGRKDLSVALMTELNADNGPPEPDDDPEE